MKVLITGATGFVGSHLAEECVQRGWDVRCLARPTSERKWLEGLDVEFVMGDLSSPENLREAVDGREVIIHVAGKTKAPDRAGFFEANAEGTWNLLEAATKYAPGLKRFVHTSSLAASGPSPSIKPINESHPMRPVTWYGQSKLKSEEYCADYSGRLPVVIIRPPAVYGPRDSDIYEFFRIVKYGIGPILGDHEKHLSIVHVKDLVSAYLLAATKENASGRTFFIANSESYSFDYLLHALAKSMGKNSLARIRISHDLVRIAAFISEKAGALTGQVVPFNRQKAIELSQRYWTCDPGLAEKLLGFRSEVSLAEGFFETARWYEAGGWL